jgi:cell shape-determining protein MreC
LVITSGLDGIFYRGAQVGIIVEVERKKLYQQAKVKTFYDDFHPTYFFVVERVPPEERNPITFEGNQTEGNMSGDGNRSDQNSTTLTSPDQNRTGG